MFEYSRRCWNYFEEFKICWYSWFLGLFLHFVDLFSECGIPIGFYNFQKSVEFHKLIWRFTSLFTMSCLFGVCKTFMLAPIGFEKNCNMLWGVDDFSRYISKFLWCPIDFLEFPKLCQICLLLFRFLHLSWMLSF